MLKILIWLAAAVAVAAGQMRLTEQDAVAQALAARASLRAATERVRSAEALRRQAGLRPNPRLTLQSENVRFWGTPDFNYGELADTYAYVTHVLETGGKRARRVGEAGAAVEQAEAKRELERFQIGSRVKQAYWRAATARKLRDLLADNVAAFNQVVEYHRVRVREGAAAEADLIRVELEGQRLESDLISATLAADHTRIQLLREMGSAIFPEVEFVSAMEPNPDTAIPDLNQALEKRLELRLLRADVARARAALEVAKAGAAPDVDVVFGYKRALIFNTLVSGVTVPLPLWNRNQGTIAAAEHDLRASEATLAAEQAALKSEVNAAWREFDVRRRHVLELFPALRARAEGSAKIALAAYREGGSDLLRLLDAERTRIEAQILYYRALGDYHLSRVALDVAAGVQP